MSKVFVLKEALTKIEVTAIAVIIIVAAVIGIYYLSLPAPTPTSSIKIGFFAPLTGPASADGYSALHGALLAVKHINDKGGVLGRRLELIYYDDACNPDQAIAVAHKLIDEDNVVAAVSGSYSSPTLAACSIYNEKGVPLVGSYAIHPEITRDKPYVFRVGMMGEVEGRVAGYAIVKYVGAKNIAILYVDIPFGATLAESCKEEAEKLGAKVVYYEKFSFEEKDFSPWLTEIAAIENLDALAFFGYYFHASAIIQARALGINVPIIGAEGFDSPKLIELAGKDAEGVIFVTDLDRDSESEVAQEFMWGYKLETGIEADMVGASAYDAVLTLAQAIEDAGTTDREAIANALSKIENLEGATGLILRFTAQGNAIKHIVLQVVREGAFHRYAKVTEIELITPPE